ncbi:hypothetical protein CRUP_004119 [Coryphaenoides rupestris]|nr:hypothetical protein CRUP_004119 [Coryphaenoides rupestris]
MSMAAALRVDGHSAVDTCKLVELRSTTGTGIHGEKCTPFSPYATALAPSDSLYATVYLSRGWMLKWDNMTAYTRSDIDLLSFRSVAPHHGSLRRLLQHHVVSISVVRRGKAAVQAEIPHMAQDALNYCMVEEEPPLMDDTNHPQPTKAAIELYRHFDQWSNYTGQTVIKYPSQSHSWGAEMMGDHGEYIEVHFLSRPTVLCWL